MIRSPAGFDGGDRIKRYLDYYQPSYGVMMLSAGQFSPALLFAAGEQGVWYDPSDFSTMFQDAAGTTPVTAVEQPVGLLLDKSKGLVLGPELVTNGDFSNGTTGWATWNTNAQMSVSNGQMTITQPVGGNQVGVGNSVAYTTVIGRTYQVSLDVISYVGAQPPQLRIGDFNGGVSTTIVSLLSGTGKRTGYFVANTTATFVNVATGSSAGDTITFDNISVKEIAGNHATQSTTASRPVLSARVNLLTYSEQFDNAIWRKPAGTTTINPNQATAPDGTMTADLVTATAGSACHYVYQVNSVSGSVTATIYAQSGTASWLGLGSGYTNGTETAWFDLSTGTRGAVAAGGTSTMTDVGNGWWRCSHTRSSWTGGGILAFITNANNAATFNAVGTETIYIWGADLRVTNVGVNLPAYQRVGAATDYNTTGFPYYLKFDGTDDSMATGTITPGVDKAQVFAGVRKQSDVPGIIAETGINSGSFGAFYLVNENTPSSNFSYAGRGARIGATNDAANAAVASPATAVITAQQDINGGTPATIRRNGSLAGSSVNTTFGGGNFLAYPLYIGRRGGASIPFNGNLYSLIVRFGSNLDATTISNTETWVNGKTMAY